jgi:2-polyprenyl-6-methoxyphenol hydroxylase-like FAD-dependent oxidoreductase
MAAVERVLVVGAGIGGLAAAAALAQRGIDVEVVEVHAEPRVYGVGINQPANSLRALRAIDVLDQIREVGFEFDRWVFHDQHGNVVVDVPTTQGGGDIPHNCALPRPELHRILIGAAEDADVEVRYGVTLEGLEEGADTAEVTFSDGTIGTYDLVVGFDGVKSPLRRRLFGDRFEPVHSGRGVWRVTVPRPAEIDYAALYQGPRNKAGWIPLTETSMYLLLVGPEQEGVKLPQEDFAELLRERLEDYGGVIGHIRDHLDEGGEIIYAPLIEVMLPSPWHRGRAIVLGDAAHACAPHLTQGAGMALEDAVVLAEMVGGGDGELDAVLTAFTERRYPRAKFVQDASRAVLDAESAVDAANLEAALAGMASDLPGQFAHIDGFLDQAA